MLVFSCLKYIYLNFAFLFWKFPSTLQSELSSLKLFQIFIFFFFCFWFFIYFDLILIWPHAAPPLFTNSNWVGSDWSVSSVGWPVVLLIRCRLSFPSMTFAVCLRSFSHSIQPVTHSIKRGQQISENSFSRTQRNQFSSQVILLSVCLWQLVHSWGESTFVSPSFQAGLPVSEHRVLLTSSAYLLYKSS